MNEDRKFGFVVGGAFALLGSALVLAGSRLAGPVLGGAGALLLVLGAAAPGLLGPLHRGWMALARVLGRVNTALFLGLVFFLVLTPLGFAFRLAGRDELARRRRRRTGWVPYPERNRDPRHFEKMF
ncbi:MAG TPA: SxtJ family membrane protein [Thermoanaerobaculia bacterium]|nr:SxtJ family membrane protein [Thermoanaerobaculia bacterium]